MSGNIIISINSRNKVGSQLIDSSDYYTGCSKAVYIINVVETAMSFNKTEYPVIHS